MSEVEGEYAEVEFVEAERPEDSITSQPDDFQPAPTSSPEVPLEESRKDETTLLVTDRVVIREDGTYVIEPR